MKKILNFFISKIKKESYAIDDRVPAGYLLKLVFQRLIMAIYGVSVCLIISIWLVMTTQKGFKVFGPGARPSNPIRSSVMDSLKSLSPQDKYKYILGWYLENIEFQYNANVNLIRKLMIFYRITLFAILIAIVGAIVLFLCILF